jgi:hypothetical protein
MHDDPEGQHAYAHAYPERFQVEEQEPGGGAQDAFGESCWTKEPRAGGDGEGGHRERRN